MGPDMRGFYRGTGIELEGGKEECIHKWSAVRGNQGIVITRIAFIFKGKKLIFRQIESV